MRKFLWILVVIPIITSCSETGKKQSVSKTESTELDSHKMSEGFNLLQNTCFSCHSPNASIDNRIAPPMIAIKKHYISENTAFEQFKKDFTTFLNNPSEENSKMPNALKRFGVMPKMNLSKADIEKMALYIYNSELEKPDWFEKHYQEEKARYTQSANVEITPIELGKQIAMRTKSTLGSNLKQAINTKGTEGALSFCSTKAISLTDSMAAILNAKIKRVSDKNRNPLNQANSSEIEYINKVKNTLAESQQIKPKLIKTDRGYIAYYPIISNKMCLQCHGNPKQDITPKVYSKIKQLYPEDKAVGYKSNELRGIWVIEMTDK